MVVPICDYFSVKDQPRLEGVGYSVDGGTLLELCELALSSSARRFASWATFSRDTPLRTWVTVSATTSGEPDAITLKSDSSAAYFSYGAGQGAGCRDAVAAAAAEADADADAAVGVVAVAAVAVDNDGWGTWPWDCP